MLQVAVDRHTLRRALARRGTDFRRLHSTAALQSAAAALAAGPGLTLAEVGYRCGFNSGSAFSRFLRRHTGLSPSEYRARLPPPRDQPAPEQRGNG